MNAQRKPGDTRRTMAAFATVAGATLATATIAENGNGTESGTPFSTLDNERTVRGVFRDFRAYNVAGGHPDFGRLPDIGAEHTMGNVADTLDPYGNLVFAGNGVAATSEWRDKHGQAIHPSLYDKSLGDSEGAFGAADDGAIESASTFSQWFADVPGVNVSGVENMTFVYDKSLKAWVYDETLPSNRAVIGGGKNANYEFSFELEMQFIYLANKGQYVEVGGLDDIWVFIDDKLVVDLGGVNHAERQYVPLDRLGLTSNEVHTIKFFMTERTKGREPARIAINFDFWDGELPTTMAMYD